MFTPDTDWCFDCGATLMTLPDDMHFCPICDTGGWIVTTSKRPTRKVGAGALAGAVTIIGVWIAGQFGLDVPGEVGSAITTVLTFGASYMVRE